MPVNYNRVLHTSDVPELMDIIQEVCPDIADSRKAWEIAMAIRSLRDRKILARKNARILGAGAGSEHTIFYLTNYAAEVHATDLYAASGDWSGFASQQMLINPMQVSPTANWNPQHLIVQHMDMRQLRYPDNHFDGIFSSGSIEHVGTNADIAQAASELGRVLRPKGVLTLATEFRLTGAGNGWSGVRLFDEGQLFEYIIKPSGLTMVDALVVPDSSQVSKPVSLEHFVSQFQKKKRVPGDYCLSFLQYTFTSVFLTLVKE